jgi:pilus assembly protein CpaB
LVLGGVAVLLARQWLESQVPDPVVITEKVELPMTTVVTANRDLFFGDRMLEAYLEEMPWPKQAVPPGTFEKIEDLIAEERIVIRSIAINEPIFRSKLSGQSGRASLSAVVTERMRAVTIRVNDVRGVAGFVLPGDRVDILLNRGNLIDIMLQNIKILGIDQNANEQANQPQVARAVTVEVTPFQAQKLILAEKVGAMSLVLRNETDVLAANQRRVTVADLTVGEINESPNANFEALARAQQQERLELVRTIARPVVQLSRTTADTTKTRVTVMRGLSSRSYSVRLKGEKRLTREGTFLAPRRATTGTSASAEPMDEPSFEEDFEAGEEADVPVALDAGSTEPAETSDATEASPTEPAETPGAIELVAPPSN